MSGRWWLGRRSSEEPAIFSDERAVPGRYTHLALVFDRRKRMATLFVDGTAQTGRLELDEPFLDPNDGPLRIGRDQFFEGMRFAPFRGRIDEVKVFDRALTPGQIAALRRTKQPVSSRVPPEDFSRCSSLR
jgi:hypothetical protein